MRRVRVLGSRTVCAGVAERWSDRIRGLIGAPDGAALLFPRTRCVHTFGLTRPIDVLLLDTELRVLAIVPLRPRRILPPRPRVRHVLELDRSPFAVGEMLSLREDSNADPGSAQR